MIDLDARLRAWVSASLPFAVPKPQMSMTVQALGQLDISLIAFEATTEPPQGPTVSELALRRFSDHITVSYLWVLGLYEVLHAHNTVHPIAHSTPLYALYGDLRRLRVPLAKFEPARATRSTDGDFAFPVFSAADGVGWLVAKDACFFRLHLADRFLLQFTAPGKPGA